MIKRELQNRHMPLRSLSRRLEMNPSTLHAMFKKKSIKVSRLVEISIAMDYNFFSEIAAGLSVKDPVIEKKLQMKLQMKDDEYTTQLDKLNKEIQELKEVNKTLQTKFDLLESVIDKLGGSK